MPPIPMRHTALLQGQVRAEQRVDRPEEGHKQRVHRPLGGDVQIPEDPEEHVHLFVHRGPGAAPQAPQRPIDPLLRPSNSLL